ncbi:MAG: hypothetical protein ACTSQE_06755 [Candidatus Heimdallarchaeaceae archaeon]
MYLMNNPFQRIKREEYNLTKNGQPTSRRNFEHLKDLNRSRYPSDKWHLEQKVVNKKLKVKATLKQRDDIHKKWY